MANQFLRYTSKSLGTGLNKVGNYDVPSSTQVTLIGLSVSNILSGGDIQVNIFLYNGSQNISIVSNAIIPRGETLIPVGADQKVVMQPGDSIQIQSNVASSVDAIMSILSIT